MRSKPILYVPSLTVSMLRQIHAYLGSQNVQVLSVEPTPLGTSPTDAEETVTPRNRKARRTQSARARRHR